MTFISGARITKRHNGAETPQRRRQRPLRCTYSKELHGGSPLRLPGNRSGREWLHVNETWWDYKGQHTKVTYRKTSDRSPRLLSVQVTLTPPPACIRDPASNRDPASIRTCQNRQFPVDLQSCVHCITGQNILHTGTVDRYAVCDVHCHVKPSLLTVIHALVAVSWTTATQFWSA